MVSLLWRLLLALFLLGFGKGYWKILQWLSWEHVYISLFLNGLKWIFGTLLGFWCQISDQDQIQILVVLPSFSVNDLLLTKDRAWNIQLLMDLFDLTTVQNIMRIHIPRIISFDKWVWVPSPSEQFSMKYAREISIAQRGCVSPFTIDIWKSLWGFKLQARLKYLLWKYWSIYHLWGYGCLGFSVL